MHAFVKLGPLTHASHPPDGRQAGCTYCPNQIRLPINLKHLDQSVFSTQLTRSCPASTAASCKSHTYPALKTMPLYAYMAYRGTRDCLLTISHHCRAVREMCRVHGKDQAKQGLWGGLQISLDMEKAFDTISRSMVSRALHVFDMSADLQHLVHSWLAPHRYCISHKELVGMFQASGGIKQGSKDAPFFWTISMYLILHDLLAQYDHAWITSHILIYADDIHLRWIITSPSEGLAALHDLSFLLRVFRAYGLRSINRRAWLSLAWLAER